MSTNAPAKNPYHTALRYTDRESKSRYIADKYRAILSGRVLDVGCDRRQLAAHLSATAAYTGVDMAPGADVVLNLDRDNLPFPDNSFDAVIASDVLEHLERLHAVFDELCRVSASRVIVSLPNPVRNLMLEVSRGSEGRLKYYGLPVDPPKDRHRWFFGAEEAAHFLRERSRRMGFEVEQLDHQEKGLPAWIDPAGVDLLASTNARLGTLWCTLKKANAAD
ncbi:hypothetical protein PHYC_02915 [Phycisphaerales bacterium]|nr:hypothetical protein PHYC_02915 [Phycisphaerales bacterium]